MSIALSEFWTRLVRTGISDAEGCKRVASAFTKANSGTPPSDAQAVARFLVKRGKLTKFQARALLATPPRELRAGSYLIRSDRAGVPFSRWVEASRIDGGSLGILLHRNLSTEGDVVRHLLQIHQAIGHESLQPLESEFHGNSLLLFSSLPAGRCLIETLLDAQPLEPVEVCRLGTTIAAALESLHLASVPHGEVRSDRIWIGDEGNVTLLRDPSASFTAGETERWLDSLDSPTSYAAPETHAPNSRPTVAADLYSLGCLLFRLATGRFPFYGENDSQTLAAHRTETPPELAAAVNLGQSGDPLFRVIAFAMAKSPTARFASAAQLAAALQATVKLLQAEGSADTSMTAPTTSSDRDSSLAIREQSAADRKVEQSAGEPKAGEQKAGEQKAAVSEPPSLEVGEASRGPASRGPASRGAEQLGARTAAPASASPDQTEQRAGTKATAPTDSESKREVREPKQRRPRTSQPEKSRLIKPARVKEPPVATSTSSEEVSSALANESADGPADSLGPPDSSDKKQPIEAPREPMPPSQGPVVPSAEVASLTLDVEGPPSAVEPPPEPDQSSGPERSVRRRRKKKSKAPLVLGALCVAVLILIIGLIASDPSEPEKKERLRPRGTGEIPPVRPNVVLDVPEEKTTRDEVSGYELVTDDRLLFVPPYPSDSASAPLELLPPGPAVILTTRLATVVGDPTRSAMLDGVAPELGELLEVAVGRAKVSPDSVRRLSLALHPGKEGWPEVSLMVELEEAVAEQELIARLEVGQARTKEGATIYIGEQDDADAFYWPGSENDSISQFAVGSVARMSEVAAIDGSAIPLPRSSQALWNGASAESELVLLFTPNFLFADGRELLASTVPELVGPLKKLTQPNVAAALISVNLRAQDRAFVEARFAPSGGISEAALLRNVTDAIQSWPQWADQFILNSVPDPSWRLLATRLPSMMRFVADQTRFGVSDGAVVANAYLPSRALPQVLLASLLAMNTPATAAGTPSTNVTTETPLTVEEMLDREMSVTFDQESLEFALEAIVSAFEQSLPSGTTMPPSRIVGGDLQLMGITQNQQVRDFAKTNLPLRTVLTDLVLGANPDKSATGATDAKQALIWVVADDPAKPGKKEILITTRQAAKSKNYELPVEFQLEQ